jgi:threonine/homoserine/homoserine lactone efflux protein
VNAFQVLDAAVKGLLIGLYMAISVGPTLFAVIKYSMYNSHKAGLAFVLGVSLSDLMYVVVANMAASLLSELDAYSRYIALGGSVVLILVGLAGLLKKTSAPTSSEDIPVISGRHYLRIFFSGFLINSINPGVILSWLTAVSTCANQPPLYRFVLFGLCLALILSIDFLKIFLAERIRRSLTPQRLRYVQWASSAIILALGLLLLYHATQSGFKPQIHGSTALAAALSQ